MTLFPKVMLDHRQRTQPSEYPTPDTEAFNISISASHDAHGCHDGYYAILTYGEKGNEATAAKGGYGLTVEAALRKLLDVLAEALAESNQVSGVCDIEEAARIDVWGRER